ncbi:Dabb family protein [Amnibacterium flavum]|uniref:Stress responsive alpha-beta barrel domain-containing protein n=1 Tax=Amnibacterium flavum TaxID=2173173 RepID=A0A2V1HN48_9MICO|nr:Dabb family protein [Amnibacterium flavum]PVZ94053.1 stress responsive alpha-beta barrel domain-containing protein [Amnibacterium flavum]
MTLADQSTLRHTVSFRLRHEPGSAEEADFLAAAAELVAIPGVQEFEVLRQVGRKNSYSFGLSMEFADAAAYAAYDAHPDHQAFVAERWIPEVEEFVEIDYQAYRVA